MWLLNHSENCSQWIFVFYFILHGNQCAMQCNKKRIEINSVILTGDDYAKYWKQLKRWQQRYRTLKWCSCIRTAIMTLCAAHAVKLYDPAVSVNHIKFRNRNFNFNWHIKHFQSTANKTAYFSRQINWFAYGYCTSVKTDDHNFKATQN